MNNSFYILDYIPHCYPYRFIDSISEISKSHVIGKCFLSSESFFYKGHFPQSPITPGYIITEIMVQIGVLALGIYLNKENIQKINAAFLTSTNVKFFNISYPNDTITVKSKLIYYKLNTIKCKIEAYNQHELLLCKGVLTGKIK